MLALFQKTSQQTLIGLIRLYRLLRPRRYPCCAFLPTCTAYAIEALSTLPLHQALWHTVRRVCRCHPWTPGGYDPVPCKKSPTTKACQKQRNCSQ